eukprot:CAMPEP_0116067910 /NCGR_PEP_ID=MMETSP0322-20121206/11351_1 /TAXON_ID=163516 /ORGANISM="Leptocylindrus danicus var. apora, Strain B651" /LENGTH=317 /DNA_ID=CAMNT_0003554929 /DNA_START=8 /DNA_END=961 /DNA_ORIENTATION=+
MNEDCEVTGPTGDAEKQQLTGGQHPTKSGGKSDESHVLFDMKGSSRREWKYVRLVAKEELRTKKDLTSTDASKAYCTLCKSYITFSKGNGNSVYRHMEKRHQGEMDLAENNNDDAKPSKRLIHLEHAKNTNGAKPAKKQKTIKHHFSKTKIWKVYLSGEIHSDWREDIAQGIRKQKLPVSLTSPNTSREDSDNCAAMILGMEQNRRNWDVIGARMNSVRTQTLIREADVVVVRFGEKYGHWNAAFDAGYAAALGKSIITLHPPSISHMLKEVNAFANVVCEDPSQVVETLAYVIEGSLPSTPRDGDLFVPFRDRIEI